MSRFTRRSLLKGAAGAAGLATASSLPGARLIRAQGASYEIVSFGPIADGVLPEGYFRPRPGGINGINGNGIAFGTIAASEEKFTPTIFNTDGTVSKLKSGAFGGTVTAMNADGTAIGRVYESVNGIDEGDDSMERPALWIDRELTRLPLPSSDSDYAGGYTTAISNNGTVLGYANGVGDVLWTNNEPQVLNNYPGDNFDERIDFLDLVPDGELVVRRTSTDGGTVRTYGLLDGDAFTEFAVPDIGDSYAYTESINSRGDLLMYAFTGGVEFNWISAVGADPQLIDFRNEAAFFSTIAVNADLQVLGWWAPRRDLDTEPVILHDGEITPLADLLPADHGFDISIVNGISDDGVISGGGYDADGGFHPLLFVPA